MYVKKTSEEHSTRNDISIVAGIGSINCQSNGNKKGGGAIGEVNKKSEPAVKREEFIEFFNYLACQYTKDASALLETANATEKVEEADAKVKEAKAKVKEALANIRKAEAKSKEDDDKTLKVFVKFRQAEAKVKEANENLLREVEKAEVRPSSPPRETPRHPREPPWKP
eukprot:GHVH01016305.1.p1 GENE.GHVH01016305.1~~GHVH01016305.1.p1  ORF type:complete len:169 (+),score=30.84 GHVH01016305.1:79-585(+)